MNRQTRKKIAQALAGGLSRTGIDSALLARRRRRGDFRVFIIDYHEVAAGPAEPEGVVSANRFRTHVEFLRERFEIVSLSDAVQRLAEGSRLEQDYLVITLDDGYVGNYDHAFGTLREHNVPATVFVATAFVDGQPLWADLARSAFELAATQVLTDSIRDQVETLAPGWPESGRDPVEALKRIEPKRRNELIEELVTVTGVPEGLAQPMTWSQISEMAAAGIEIGCHTVNHPILPTLSAAEQLDEISQSRSRIAEMTGISPSVFAYPNGDYNEASVDALRQLGFAAACTTRRGFNVPGCDRFRLQRIGIGADSTQLVAARLTGLFDQRRRERMREMGLGRSQMAHGWVCDKHA